MALVVNGQTIATDKEGFLKHLDDWNVDVAHALAAQENITLTDAHWQIINVLNAFYKEFDLSPAMRPLVKYVGIMLGEEKGKSIYLMRLFPPSPAKIGSKIAGLPRPDNCL